MKTESHRFLIPVATEGHNALLPFIKQYILPGTTIIIECRKTCNGLSLEGCVHLTINHTYNFVDPGTGPHTQHIERLLREVRGNTKHHFIRHLAEFMFKRKR